LSECKPEAVTLRNGVTKVLLFKSDASVLGLGLFDIRVLLCYYLNNIRGEV